MGNDLPCCILGRSKTRSEPLSKPVLRPKHPKHRAAALLDTAALMAIQPRRPHALYTPHILLKLLRMDLIQTAYLLEDTKATTSLTFFVTAAIEEKRKEKLADETVTQESIRPPKYELLKISSLSTAQQRDLAWILSEYKGTEGEKLDGFLEVKKISRFGIPRQRIAIFSTEALYICESKHIRVMKKRIKWGDVANIVLAHDDRSVSIAVHTSTSTCTLFTPNSPDIVNAIKTLYHLKFREFPSVTMAVAREMALEDVNEAKKRENCQLLLQEYGNPHEQIVKCIEIGTLDAKKRKEKMILLISTLCLYRVSSEFRLQSIIPLQKLTFIVQIDDLAQVLVQSSIGDYWVIHMQAKSLGELIQKVHFAESGNALEVQVMGFKQAFELFHPKPVDRLTPRTDTSETSRRDSNYYTISELTKSKEPIS